MPTAYRIHGGQYKNPNDYSTLITGTEEEHGTYKTYDAAYKAWRDPAMRGIDNYHHRLIITPVAVPPEEFDKLPG
jgi:hypothetical protein